MVPFTPTTFLYFQTKGLWVSSLAPSIHIGNLHGMFGKTDVYNKQLSIDQKRDLLKVTLDVTFHEKSLEESLSN